MIGVVIVNWNGWRDTIECLQSILPALNDETRVVVVDNCSTNDSVERLVEWGSQRCPVSFLTLTGDDEATDTLPEITLLRVRTNDGFAAGNNAGLELLRRRGGCEFYWLLNNDTVIDEYAITALTTFARAHPEMGLIGSTVAEYDERDLVQCAGGAYYDSWSTLNHAGHRGSRVAAMSAAPEPRMNYVCGAAMFMRGVMVEDVGGLSEDYFLFYEEIDYARRAIGKGYRLGWCRDALVYHRGGATTGGNRRYAAKKSALAEYHANLSCLKYTRRFDNAAFPVSSATRFVLKLGHHLFAKQWHLVSPLVEAYLDYFSGSARR